MQFATFPETVAPYYPYFSYVQPPYRRGHYSRPELLSLPIDRAPAAHVRGRAARPVPAAGQDSEDCLTAVG